MKLDRIPLAILMSLGLVPGCTDDGEAEGEASTGPCLDVATSACLGAIDESDDGDSHTSFADTGDDGQESDVGPCLSQPPGSTTDGGESDVGPCLDVADTSAGSTGDDDTSTGPCLSPGTSEGGDSDTGDSGSDTGIGTSGGMASRDDVIHRVLDGAALPPDVVARLRSRLGKSEA